jgi:hypothetical protein
MSERRDRNTISRHEFDRRLWLRQAVAAAAACAAGLGGAPRRGEASQESKLTPPEEAVGELDRAKVRVRAVTSRPLVTVSSDGYQAVGDAAASFMKLALGDCELIARDFLDHYQAKGFGVKRPNRRLTLVIFFDERPYLEFVRKFAVKIPTQAMGFYSRPQNWLVLYDFRNVPMKEQGAAQKNVRTLTHEATHQLTFNTGLLNRRGDAPRAVMEGLASYSEPRGVPGHNEPGQLNGRLLDDLAHIRRRLGWITATDLLTDDETSFGSTLDQTLLAYAQAWLLVHHLMTSPARLAQFQAYLKAIYTRTGKEHRFDDAERNFGDLDRLDQELRREAIRLQQSPPP